MKKLISLISSAALCMAAIPFAASAEEGTATDWEHINAIYEGISNGTYDADFDRDGRLTRADANAILRFYSEVSAFMIEKDGTIITSSSLSDESRALIVANGNIDGNDTIDAVDASFFLDYIYKNNDTEVGDVNNDGIIDAVDASYILAYYAYQQTGVYEQIFFSNDIDVTYGQIESFGDYNGDGLVDAIDASLVLSDYAKTNA